MPIRNIMAVKNAPILTSFHSMSTSGLKGEGVYSKIPELPNIEVIVVASVAKALGVDADVILGDRKTIQTLSSSSVYAGSSPPSPGILYAYVWASEIYRNGLNRLRDNMKVFTDLIQRKTGINYIKGFPVFLLKDQHAAEYLVSERKPLIFSKKTDFSIFSASVIFWFVTHFGKTSVFSFSEGNPVDLFPFPVRPDIPLPSDRSFILF